MKRILALILLILTTSSISQAADVFSVKVSADLKNLSSISFPTPEGVHSFTLSKVDAVKYLAAENESDGQYFKAKHARPVIGNVNTNAAAELTDGTFKLNFFGRRKGRAYQLTVDLTQTARPLIARLSHVGTSFSPECASLDAPKTRAISTSDEVLGSSGKMNREITLSVDADYPFYQKFKLKGQSAAKSIRYTKNYIRSTVNQVNAIYSDQLGIIVKLNALRIDTTNERSISSNDSDDVLESFRYFTDKNKTIAKSDIYHLFTNNRMSGSVVGLAYVGATCRAALGNYSFGLSRLTNPAVQSLITAHEIAHNLGATHIEGDNSIMSPVLSPSKNKFIPISVNQIVDFVFEFGACLEAVGS